jgi:hypothetical protein
MKNKRNGFSIMETVLGMFGLIVVSMISNAYMMAFMKTNVSIKEVSQATAIGHTVIEQLRMKAYTSLKNDSNTVDNKYQCSWSVQPQASSAMSVINLTVQWPLNATSPQKRHTIHLSTIRAQ